MVRWSLFVFTFTFLYVFVFLYEFAFVFVNSVFDFSLPWQRFPDPLIVMVCECRWSNPLLASIQTQLCEIQFDAEIPSPAVALADSEIIEDVQQKVSE